MSHLSDFVRDTADSNDVFPRADLGELSFSGLESVLVHIHHLNHVNGRSNDLTDEVRQVDNFKN